MAIGDGQIIKQVVSLDAAGIQFAELVTPFIVAMVAVVATLVMKNAAEKIAKGLAFKWDKAFNEGDQIILDGQSGVIVKIGLLTSVFGIYSENGYTWRYVPNERIPFLKLEKIINKDLHLDGPVEMGRKLQQLIDQAQDHQISANKKEIESLKNKK